MGLSTSLGMKMTRDPFASLIHVLIPNGVGPHEVDLDMRDHYVVLKHRIDNTAIRVLHLQNVRDDTVAMTRTTVDDFRNELKLTDGHNGAVHPEMSAHTMLDAYDEVEVYPADPTILRRRSRSLAADCGSHGSCQKLTFRDYPCILFCHVINLQPTRV